VAHKAIGMPMADADSDGGLTNVRAKISDKYDLLEENQRQKEEDNDEEGYTIDAELILRAWKRFRPVNAENQKEPKTGEKRSKPRTQETSIETVFGPKFTLELMSSIHLRLYNFQELPDEIDKKKQFKESFKGHYKE
jgi:hypothetical protein